MLEYVYPLVNTFIPRNVFYNFTIVGCGVPTRELLIHLISENFFKTPHLNINNYPYRIHENMLKLNILYKIFESEFYSVLTFNQLIYFYIFSILPVEDKFQFSELFFNNIHHVRSYDKNILFDVHSSFHQINEALKRATESTGFVLDHRDTPGWNIEKALKQSNENTGVDLRSPRGGNRLNLGPLLFMGLGLTCIFFGCVNYFDKIKLFL